MKTLLLLIILTIAPVALSQATQAPDKAVVVRQVKVDVSKAKKPQRRWKRILIAILLTIMNIDKRGVVDR
jgi:hypothetical protein